LNEFFSIHSLNRISNIHIFLIEKKKEKKKANSI